MSGHEVLLNIAGGVALLLWATRMIRTGVMRAWGSSLRSLLTRSTRNPLSAFAVGLGVTGAVQSSTATALLLVSFAGSGLVGVGPGLAVMLGADVGSTLVAQVLSFDLSWLSPILLVIGVLTFMTTTGTFWPHIGRLVIGLGMMLLALKLVVAASDPLRDSETLQVVMAPLANDLILALLLGAVLTWIFHSSVAMVLLIMSLTASGVVPLLLGLALVLGANVGAGMIPMVMTLRGSPSTRRIPFGNLMFRVIGAFALLPVLAWVLPVLSLLGDDPARQVANFHTLFNVALAVVFLPLTGLAARLVERLFKDDPKDEAIQPRYLDPAGIKTPTVALANATREVLRMADIVEHMLRGVIEILRKNDSELLQRIQKQDDEVDELHEAIKLYLTELSRNELSQENSKRCVELITFNTNLEHIGDIIEKNLLEIAQKKIAKQLSFSEQGLQDITEMHGKVVEQMQLAMSVFVSGDLSTARRMLAAKDELRELERSGGKRHIERLRSGRPETIETSSLHLDILRDLKRINSHLTSVAYPILDAEGQLRQSRLKRTKLKKRNKRNKLSLDEDADTEADEMGSDLVVPKRL